MSHRPISFLKEAGDLEWLAEKRCPRCKTRGKLRFGMHPRERVTCDQCGHRFKIPGRKVEA